MQKLHSDHERLVLHDCEYAKFQQACQKNEEKKTKQVVVVGPPIKKMIRQNKIRQNENRQNEIRRNETTPVVTPSKSVCKYSDT